MTLKDLPGSGTPSAFFVFRAVDNEVFYQWVNVVLYVFVFQERLTAASLDLE